MQNKTLIKAPCNNALWTKTPIIFEAKIKLVYKKDWFTIRLNI